VAQVKHFLHVGVYSSKLCRYTRVRHGKASCASADSYAGASSVDTFFSKHGLVLVWESRMFFVRSGLLITLQKRVCAMVAAMYVCILRIQVATRFL
jgi:hypothetical protein